jgi:hypothetical protein
MYIAACGMSGTESNNGMHPTADTLLLMFLQSRGAAGDAERYAASHHIGGYCFQE